MFLYLDTETTSGVDLKKRGVYKYIQDKDFRLLLISYAINNQEPQVCTPDEIPADLRYALDSNCTVVIHNSAFDVPVLRASGIANISYDRVHDTMVQALSNGLPKSLEELSNIFELGEYGKKNGSNLIKKYCKNANPDINSQDWKAFKEYALFDIVAMRKIYRIMPRFNYPNGNEKKYWLINREINDIGIGVDVELAQAAATQVISAIKTLNKQCHQICGYNATQTAAILEYIKEEYNINLPNLQKKEVKDILRAEDLPKEVRAILEIRSKISSSAIKKYIALLGIETKGRIKETLQFMGAPRTGRDSGRYFQPQNLKRPVLFNYCKNDEEENVEIEKVVELVKQNKTSEVGNPFDVLSDLVRNVIIPSTGKKLVVADLSNIEGRILPWLAEEKWKIQNFYDFDSGLLKYDNYVIAYSKAMQVPMNKVTKEMRAIGKVMELSLGYGGGVKPFSEFAKIYGMDLKELAKQVRGTVYLPEDVRNYENIDNYHYVSEYLTQEEYKACNYLKSKWRKTHPKISDFWNELAEKYRYCILNKDKPLNIGKKLKIIGKGDWIYIRLPSGRYINYYKPGIDSEGNLYYLGQIENRVGIAQVKTYGGKLASNVTSGTARDVLYQALPDIKAAGYTPVLLVHDEVVAEAPISNEFSSSHLAQIMSTPQKWCLDLPLAAAGFESMRYKGK